MTAKIVLTERGLKISNELFALPTDELPPFVEEARPHKNQPTPPLKLNRLFENSNGYLDRVTLRSAESTHR